MDRDFEAEDTIRGSREWKALNSRLLGIQVELQFLKVAVLYRKYAVDQPRVPAGSPEGGRWTHLAISVPAGTLADDSVDERIRVAQNGPFRWTGARVTSRISGRLLEGTPGQFTQFAVINAQAAAATTAVRQFDRNWRPPASLTETIEGEIAAADARLLAANARLRELGDPEVEGEVTHACLVRNGEPIGWVAKDTKESIRTVTRDEFDRVLTELMLGSREMEPPSTYSGCNFLRSDGTSFGVRWSKNNRETIDIMGYDTFHSIVVRRIHWND